MDRERGGRGSPWPRVWHGDQQTLAMSRVRILHACLTLGIVVGRAPPEQWAMVGQSWGVPRAIPIVSFSFHVPLTAAAEAICCWGFFRPMNHSGKGRTTETKHPSQMGPGLRSG